MHFIRHHYSPGWVDWKTHNSRRNDILLYSPQQSKLFLSTHRLEWKYQPGGYTIYKTQAMVRDNNPQQVYLYRGLSTIRYGFWWYQYLSDEFWLYLHYKAKGKRWKRARYLCRGLQPKRCDLRWYESLGGKLWQWHDNEAVNGFIPQTYFGNLKEPLWENFI